MLTKQLITEKTADLEDSYVDFCLRQFGAWRDFAQSTRQIYAGNEVNESDVPQSYLHEFRMLREILKMDATGKFDWANPVLKESFSHFVTSDYYQAWGSTITEIAVRLSRLAGIKTLVEIGAGRGNLTDIMLTRLDAEGMFLPLLVTDVAPEVLGNISEMKKRFPRIPCETMCWDIKQQPPPELTAKIERPCLLYERASIMYTNIPAIANMAEIADVVVFGDMFNYTGELDAYDEIAKKIGGMPLFYSELKPLMAAHYTDHFMFDLRAQVMLGSPTTTIMIGWK